jgi:disulfide oxidoreductase YuzD
VRGRRGGRLLKRKRLKRSFKIRYVFIILKKSAKKKITFAESKWVSPKVILTEREPTRK